MEQIYIKNTSGKYLLWDITDYNQKYDTYNICLNKNKSFISSISANKIWTENKKSYSDVVKDIDEKNDVANTSFGTITI